jgi:hypothetical protein
MKNDHGAGFMRRLFAIPLALLIVGVAGPAHADTLTMPRSGYEQPGMDMPSRGMTMDQVQRAYGQPRSIKPAVGDPPITRWVYEHYTVYFEHSHVIHSVPHRP